MSAFGIGINNQSTNSGGIRGTQMEISCACWFTNQWKPLHKIKKAKG